MMSFQNLKASSFGDLLDNPSGWTAKGGQPGDARGIVPAHVKGSTPDSAPSSTQEERTQAGTPPPESEDTPTGSTQDGTPEERTASAPVLSHTPAGAHTQPGTQAVVAEESAAGPMNSTPEAMLMYGKEASNRKQEIDRQHYTIPNQRPKDKHCGKI